MKEHGVVTHLEVSEHPLPGTAESLGQLQPHLLSVLLNLNLGLNPAKEGTNEVALLGDSL